MAELVRRLKAARAHQRLAAINAERRAQQASGRVRTYDLHKRLITDHRSGRKTTNVDAVLDGHLDLVRS